MLTTTGQPHLEQQRPLMSQKGRKLCLLRQQQDFVQGPWTQAMQKQLVHIINAPLTSPWHYPLFRG